MKLFVRPESRHYHGAHPCFNPESATQGSRRGIPSLSCLSAAPKYYDQGLSHTTIPS